jgi:hypothetical protein
MSMQVVKNKQKCFKSLNVMRTLPVKQVDRIVVQLLFAVTNLCLPTDLVSNT